MKIQAAYASENAPSPATPETRATTTPTAKLDTEATPWSSVVTNALAGTDRVPASVASPVPRLADMGSTSTGRKLTRPDASTVTVSGRYGLLPWVRALPIAKSPWPAGSRGKAWFWDAAALKPP